MKRSSHVLRVAMLLATPVALAQQPAAYPSQGQDSATQASDEAACRTWAQGQTGVNAGTAAPIPPQQTGAAVGGGERGRGAIRGATAGAVVGGIANDDAGHGAAVGAAAGVVGGGMRSRQNRRAQNAAIEQQQAATQGAFNQAYASCMTGKGYSIH